MTILGTVNDVRVAVIIPAKDEAEVIASTVRACRAIPKVDLVLVVDDGSEDDTQSAARSAGAVVVRHSVNRGKAAAMETGGSVVAMRDIEGREPRLMLFVDGDLGENATSCAALIPPVASGSVDLSIAVVPDVAAKGPLSKLSRTAIERSTGWSPLQPLSGQRCMTREAFDAATPLSRGWGVEVGMTIDVITAGYTVQEIPVVLGPNYTERPRYTMAQYRDIQLAIATRRIKGVSVPREIVKAYSQLDIAAGEPFSASYS